MTGAERGGYGLALCPLSPPVGFTYLTNHQHNHAYGQKAVTIMAIQSESRRPLYERLKEDLWGGPVNVADYNDEFGEYKDFPSGIHLINPMTQLLAYLAKPQSRSIRKELGLTTGDGKGAVLRIGSGRYRWYPSAYWKDTTSILSSFAGIPLPNLANLKKQNPYITFVDPISKTDDPKPSIEWDDIQSKTDWLGLYNKMSKDIKKYKPRYSATNGMPVPDATTRVVTVPPPAIQHYGTPGTVMAPLAEVIHHEADTLIVKVDGKVLVCKIQTEVK